MTLAPDHQHFLDLTEVSGSDLRKILDAARRLKTERRGALRGQGPLAGKVLAMIFERPSTRTRVSFDVGMRELGGETLMLTGEEMQLGRGRDDFRYGQGAVALCRRDHDPHPRS